jgi:hypothetical protein
LLKPAERNPDPGWIVVVSADEVGAADPAKVLEDELG